MTNAPCGSASCPVPEKPSARLRSVVWPAGTRLHRGHQSIHAADQLVPGKGATRFAPQDGSAHLYVATTELGALLESALHEAAPPRPRIQVPTLRQWSETVVKLRTDIRLFDLRDDELDRLGLTRDQVVATAPLHYACTRRWASHLVGGHAGAQPVHGLVWDSRQLELHARAVEHRPALATMLDQHPGEVAVIWSPPAPKRLLATVAGQGLGRLSEGAGWEFVEDLIGLLGIICDPG